MLTQSHRQLQCLIIHNYSNYSTYIRYCLEDIALQSGNWKSKISVLHFYLYRATLC